MIFTRMGSEVLQILSHDSRQSDIGTIWLNCRLRSDGVTRLAEVHISDLRADGGYAEIAKAMSGTPTHVANR